MNQNKVVLIVDDDEELRHVLAGELARGGYVVQVAQNGAEALAWLQNQHALPALILLDIVMPKMDGVTFRNLQQQDPRISAIPVVPLTATSHWHERAKALGFLEYIAKPVLVADVVEVVARYCAT